MRGIWKNPPPGWPNDVDFVDPNNKMRASADGVSRKPTKELLIPMLQHLVMKYCVSTAFVVGSVCMGTVSYTHLTLPTILRV